MAEAPVLMPTTVAEVQAAVRETPQLLARGRGTKPALSTPPAGVATLDLSALSGVLDYNPSEFTFTALAGTPVAEVLAMLSERGQYLPFDPPLAAKGATLGGTLAAGLSGPGRYRYGGVRDFILGVRLVDGNGEVVRGGGKVVKNAAGFDIPKLMVGSLGQLGVLVELTFKVFPQALAHVTIFNHTSTLDEAMHALYRLYTARIEIDAFDLERSGNGMKIWVRLAGLPDALAARAEHVRQLLGGGEPYFEPEVESACWNKFRNFENDLPGKTLIKIPIIPKRIPEIESAWQDSHPMVRHYSSGGNVLWLSSPDTPSLWNERLLALGLSGLVIFGPPGQSRLGLRTGQPLEQRVKSVFDPHNRFPSY